MRALYRIRHCCIGIELCSVVLRGITWNRTLLCGIARYCMPLNFVVWYWLKLHEIGHSGVVLGGIL